MNSVRIKAALCIFLTILQMSYIFVMSAQDSEDSSVISAFVSKIVGQFTVEDFRDKSKQEQDDIVSSIDSPLREVAHFIEYAILGALLYLDLYYCFYRKGKRVLILTAAFMIGVIYAVTDEIHQIHVPGRAFEIFDIGLDSAGTLAGVLLTFLIMKIRSRKNEHTS
ncbi:MAG: VanZ family protein [Lachnospiraceae bacterium]|nr:VanZ family protein [Lachnospiraceae bacterium]